MVYHDGMARMQYRTTFALDRDSMLRLRRLSRRWGVSQAEVVRRALREVESAAEAVDPLVALRALQTAGEAVTREEADRYLAEVDEDRA